MKINVLDEKDIAELEYRLDNHELVHNYKINADSVEINEERVFERLGPITEYLSGLEIKERIRKFEEHKVVNNELLN